MSGAAHGAEIEVVVETAAHRAAPEVKLLALVAFVVSVALVPHGLVWPYAIDALLLAAVAVWARTPPGHLARRLVVEVPFVLFVVLLPFVTHGERTHVLGIGLSEPGLWMAWGIVAKATLAVLAAGVLAWTTPMPELLAGAERLRVPRTMTTIAAFAVRYLQVVLDELGRQRTARVARGDDPRWLWQARGAARSAGALAVRCLERGERVHVAMLARGFDGRMPAGAVPAPVARTQAWLLAALVVAGAVVTTLIAHTA